LQAFYTDHFVLPLPEGHRFPMAKYAMLRDAVKRALPAVELQQAPAASADELTLVHTRGYVSAVADGCLSSLAQREIGFPWSEAMAERSRRSVGATLAAVHAAMQTGVAGNLAGGTHHAYADRGGGFCVFNDLAVAARRAQQLWAQSHTDALLVAVIDLDVHQGNGTADIFQGDPSVFTLSVHGEKNFPFSKQKSDLDVGLPDGCADDQYLDALGMALRQLDGRFEPGLVLFLAGADPFEGDRLGRLKISFEGMRRRDHMVFSWCGQRRCPVAFAMGGGYGVRIEETVAVQLNTFGIALESWQRWQNHGYD
jgi:acetoin utilization deacetylase AcuC-like enzyme